MSSSALYWVLHILGWGTFWAINTVFGIASGHLSPTRYPLTMALCSATGILGTHVWRGYIQTYGYLEMPLARSGRRYLAGVLVVGCGLTLIAGVWYRLLLIPNTFQELGWVPYALISWTATVAIWTLSYISGTSFRRANVLEKQRLKTELLAKETRLEVLRQQLNPHFLFNSLNSLRALIYEDAAKASTMVDRLAALLRYSLQAEHNQLAPLSEELIMVGEYLSIERIRFEDRLQVEMDIADGCRAACLPRMLLQTLVENAVKHGIERSVYGGTVSIAAQLENGALRIKVLNPGVLLNQSNSTHVGLKNAAQRLALLMGPGAVLDIRQAGPQVEATVLIPQ